MSLTGEELDAAVAERIMDLPSDAHVPNYSGRAYDAFWVALTKGQFRTDYGAQYVGVLISVVPILAVFAAASKRIIGGITVGALKE